MRIKNYLTYLFIIAALISCKKNIFGPNKGKLTGTITDNIGNKINGATVTAKYLEEDSENIETLSYKTINVTTNEDGFFELKGVILSENEILIVKNGLESQSKYIVMTQQNNNQELNFSLKGTPEISSYTLSESTIYTSPIDSSFADTTSINIVVNDDYNDATVNYSAKCLLYQGTVLKHIIDLSLQSSAVSLFIFETDISATALSVGTYSISTEVTDADGNTVITEHGNLIVQ